MSNVLEKIVEDKRVEIEARMAETPLEQIKQGLTPSTKSLFDALNAPNAGYILECKKASPSKGSWARQAKGIQEQEDKVD